MLLSIILVLVLIICVATFLKSKAGEGLQGTLHQVMGGVLNKGEYESKYHIDTLLSSIKRKTGIDGPFNRGEATFDSVTLGILKSKKDIMTKLYPDLTLEEAIAKRPHDESQLAQAKCFEGCPYDKEVELLSALIYLDEDPVLAMPFYNEALIKEKIEMDASLIMIADIEETGDIFQTKCNVIRAIKGMYQGVNKDLVDGVLKDNITL